VSENTWILWKPLTWKLIVVFFALYQITIVFEQLIWYLWAKRTIVQQTMGEPHWKRIYSRGPLMGWILLATGGPGLKKSWTVPSLTLTLTRNLLLGKTCFTLSPNESLSSVWRLMREHTTAPPSATDHSHCLPDTSPIYCVTDQWPINVADLTCAQAFPVPYPAQKFGGGTKMFDFRRIKPFSLGYRLPVHKMTISSKNLWGPWPPIPPWLRLRLLRHNSPAFPTSWSTSGSPGASALSPAPGC